MTIPREGDATRDFICAFDEDAFDEDAFDDAERKRRKFIRRVNLSQVFSEGFHQYGLNGERIFNHRYQGEPGEPDSIGDSTLIQ